MGISCGDTQKRTCMVGPFPTQQVRFFLVRMYYGMTVHQEGWTIPLHGRKFFWPCTIRTQSAYFIESNSLLLISSETLASQHIKYPPKNTQIGLESHVYTWRLPRRPPVLLLLCKEKQRPRFLKTAAGICRVSAQN